MGFLKNRFHMNPIYITQNFFYQQDSSDHPTCDLIQVNLIFLLAQETARDPEMFRTKVTSRTSSWWFQPIWKILVKLDYFPR